MRIVRCPSLGDSQSRVSSHAAKLGGRPFGVDEIIYSLLWRSPKLLNQEGLVHAQLVRIDDRIRPARGDKRQRKLDAAGRGESLHHSHGGVHAAGLDPRYDRLSGTGPLGERTLRKPRGLADPADDRRYGDIGHDM